MIDALEETDARLSRLSPDRQGTELLNQWRSDDPLLRFAAMENLTEREDPRVVPALRGALQDNYSRIRQRWVERAGDIAPQIAWEVLAQGIQDDDDWVREAASMQFSLRLGRPTRVPPPPMVARVLVRALEDPSQVVCVNASAALAKRYGRSQSERRIRPSTVPSVRRRVVADWKAWLAHRPEAAAPVPTPVAATRSDPAPPYAFSTLDRTRIDSRTRGGRWTLLHFWGTWCRPSEFQMPDLQRLHERLADRPVDLFGLAIAEPGGEPAVSAWIRARAIRFPQALCPPDVVRGFGDILEAPVTVLLDGNGRLRARWDGERESASFEKVIRRRVG